MKKILLSIALIQVGINFSQAQVLDTVTMGPGYANNVWYSLKNDNQAESSAINWDLGLAATSAQNSQLTTAILFNHKVGNVFEIPSSDPMDFENADTTGITTWSPLYNSDTAWQVGALNRTTNLGQFDYGWGSYNVVSHNLDANRVFVIKYSNGTYKKFHISLASMQGRYTIVSSNLDNSNLETSEIEVANYGSKNFVYYSFTSNTIIDREPAAESWDLYFGQYMSSDYNPSYQVTGVLHNLGVRATKVYPVDDVETFSDWNSVTLNESISTIGYDWKALTPQFTFEISDSTVYIIQAKNGEIWKLVFTGFIGNSAGKFIFTKQQLTFLSNEDIKPAIFAHVFPNPAQNNATIVVNQADASTLYVYNSLGQIMYQQEISGNDLQKISLETSSWSNGIYIISIQGNGSHESQRLVIQH
jgi:hypothetical protein